MTLRNPAWAFQGVSHSAELAKEMQQSFLAGTGVVELGDLAVSALGTPNMSVNVAAGSIWIPGTQGSTTGEGTNLTAQSSALYGPNMSASFTSQGSYFAYNDATVNLAISPANSSNPRIDAVVASIQDSTYSGGTQAPVLQVITGTPAATPVPPMTVPANSVVLAQVYVGASVSVINAGNITDVRPFMAPNPTQVANLLGNLPSAGVSSSMQWVVGTQRIQWWASPVVAVSAGAIGTYSINFPIAFSGTPTLVLATPESPRYSPATSNYTSSSFQLQVGNWSSSAPGTTNIRFYAIGPA